MTNEEFGGTQEVFEGPEAANAEEKFPGEQAFRLKIEAFDLDRLQLEIADKQSELTARLDLRQSMIQNSDPSIQGDLENLLGSVNAIDASAENDASIKILEAQITILEDRIEESLQYALKQA